jgi:hypothetical protein
MYYPQPQGLAIRFHQRRLSMTLNAFLRFLHAAANEGQNSIIILLSYVVKTGTRQGQISNSVRVPCRKKPILRGFAGRDRAKTNSVAGSYTANIRSYTAPSPVDAIPRASIKSCVRMLHWLTTTALPRRKGSLLDALTPLTA